MTLKAFYVDLNMEYLKELGPILFSIYINDLQLLKINGSISAFADRVAIPV